MNWPLAAFCIWMLIGMSNIGYMILTTPGYRPRSVLLEIPCIGFCALIWPVILRIRRDL